MRFLAILLLLGSSCNGDPALQTAAPLASPEGIVELEALSEAERGPDQDNGRRRIGAHRKLPESLPGAWIGEGDAAVWRLEVRSPGAAALRLHFTDFHLPGGSVLIYEADEDLRPQRERRHQADGPGGDGEFWSDLIEGEAAVVEYRPASPDKAETPPFQIKEISHLWVSPLDAF